MRVFSGIQATGAKHIGNYIGAMRQYVSTQDEGDAFFCIVDLHSITTDYDPQISTTARSTWPRSSMRSGSIRSAHALPAEPRDGHAEAAWLLSAVTGFGQLGRMTQFKEKGEGKEFVSAGLFTYPVLMAGDILLYQTDIVPVGDDQRQHVELSRDIAQRFNSRFGETFKVPEGRLTRRSARGSWTCRSRRRRCRRRAAPTRAPCWCSTRRTRSARSSRSRSPTRAARCVRARREAGRLEPDRDPRRLDRAPDPRGRGRLRRPRLRRPEERRRRGGGRALRARAGPLRRASSRRGRTAPAARASAPTKARETVGADARADVRAHGLRPALMRPIS